MVKNLGIFKDNTDGTLKCTFIANEKDIIEMSLLMNRKDTDVVCVPTHHFCNLGCKMCHLTNNALNKIMVPIKVGDFVDSLEKTVCNQKTGERRTNKKILLLSFMGVGEPLLNIKLIEDIFDRQEELKLKLGYEAIGYALSTMMPNSKLFDNLQKLVLRKNIPLKIHFSLHTPIDIKRMELIPATSVSINDVFILLDTYNYKVKHNDIIMSEYHLFHSTSDVVEIHYTLINGINDGEEELNIMTSLMKSYPFTVKFINFNPKNEMKSSERLTVWMNSLQKNTECRVKFYCPPGKEVGSSCGEFTKHYYHEEIETDNQKKEFEKWYNEHIIFD